MLTESPRSTAVFFFSRKKRDLASNYSWEYDFTVEKNECHINKKGF